MRLLRRSPRRIWLLAGAVWIGLCAVFLWGLPVLPSTTMTLPNTADFLGFGPSNNVGLVRRWETDAAGETGGPGWLELIAIPAGNTLAKLLRVDGGGGLYPEGRSQDARIWLFHEGFAPNMRHWKVDLAARTAELLRIGPLEPKTLSGDGQFLALQDSETASLIVWSVADNTRYATLPGLLPPAAFSDNGRWLAATVADGDKKKLRVVDTRLLSTVFEFEVPTDINSVGLSRNGRLAIGRVYDSPDKIPDYSPICFEVAEHLRRDFGDLTQVVISPSERTAIGRSREPVLEWHDIATGEKKIEIAIDAIAPWHMSPDGRFAFVPFVETHQVFWRDWLNRLGIVSTHIRKRDVGIQFFDAESGSLVGTIPAQWSRAYPVGASLPVWVLSAQTHWSPDSSRLATCEYPYRTDEPTPTELENWFQWEIWDIPPRKSLLWFAAGAALLALPIAFVARRRARKLRSA
jgi:hypothetical protein